MGEDNRLVLTENVFSDDANQTPVAKRRQVVGTVLQASKKIDLGFDDICVDNAQLKLGNKGCLLMVRLIKERPRALRRLQIEGHGIGDKGGSALFEQLANDKTITSLEIGSNSLGPVAMRKCYDMLQVNVTLTFLDLDKNRGLRETGAILIGASLRVNQTLKGLCMNGCGLPVKGMIAIAEGLDDNNTLKTLSLSGNANSAEVAIKFAKALRTNSSLKSFNLSGGSKKIGNKGVTALAEALEINVTLERLYLTSSGIKESGAVAIGKMISHNEGLRTIDLYSNSLGQRGMYSIVQGLQLNTTIVNLHVSSFSSRLGIQIQQLVGMNRSKNEDFLKTTYKDVLKDDRAMGPLNRSKLMFIGQGRAGKTATVRALLGEPFEPEWNSTIAASLNEAKVSPNWGWMKVSENEKYEFTKDFAAGILLRDVETLQTERREAGGQNMQEDKGKLVTGTNLAGEEEVRVAGDEVEPANEVVKTAHKKNVDPDDTELQLDAPPLAGYDIYARQYQEGMLEAARDNRETLKFSIWDYGGQRVFYSLHHLFMSKHGIYVLCFSMQQMLKQPNLCRAYLQFWLNSLSLHAPETPLLLIGTFGDLVTSEEDIRSISLRVGGVLEKYPFNVVPNEEHNLQFFPISNKFGTGIGTLREAVDATARKQDYTTIEMPLSWIYTIEYLLSEYGKPWITMSDLKTVAGRYRVTSAEEVDDMITTFNDLGLVLHMKQTSSLRDVINLDPQWLMKKIGRIIRDHNLHKHNMKAIKKAGLEEDLQVLFKEGLVSLEFLGLVWNQSQMDYLIDVMKQTVMMSDWNFTDSSVSKSGRTFYFIPCLVTGSKDLEDYDDDEKTKTDAVGKEETSETREDFLSKRKENIMNLSEFEFKFLPDGVFDRLICLCVAHANLLKSEKAPVISEEYCEIFFASGAAIKLYERKHFETIFIEIGVDNESLAYAKNALMIVVAMLQKLRNDIIGKGLDWKVFFPRDGSERIAYDTAYEKKVEPWFGSMTKLEFEADNKVVEHIDVGNFLETLQDI